jgi:hypothetical protein
MINFVFVALVGFALFLESINEKVILYVSNYSLCKIFHSTFKKLLNECKLKRETVSVCV